MTQQTNASENKSNLIKPYKVACIGAGKMLTALIGGMIDQGYDPQHIMATRRDADALQALSERFAIQVSDDNHYAASWADVIILGVKPLQFAELLSGLSETCQSRLIISVMAGVDTGKLKSCLNHATENTFDDWAIVRAMPNLPCQLSQGVTGLFADDRVSIEQKKWTEQLFAALGVVLWLSDEAKMHALTVISGSGPAYFFLLQEYLVAFAMRQGFSQQEAETLVNHTAAGAVNMLRKSELSQTESGQADHSAKALRAMISSPGGVTEKVISTLEQDQLQQIWQQALSAGCLHSEGMAERE